MEPVHLVAAIVELTKGMVVLVETVDIITIDIGRVFDSIDLKLHKIVGAGLC